MNLTRRTFWLKRVDQALTKRSVLWLAGVRRSGKTCLVQSMPNIEYFDCELPRTRRAMEDSQSCLDSMKKGSILVIDEVHRLNNPSELLKIAADHYPHLKVIATGSSTLNATAKFKDSLAGRKTEIWLTPMCMQDIKDFGSEQLSHRFLRGGLPPFFLSDELPERDYQEWIDSFWAKDIQELFRLERRNSFQKFFELLMQNSGGIFDATKYSKPCEISRTSVSNYLSALEETFVAHVVRPFSSRKSTEIIAQPKVYAMDTGFVSYFRGWDQLRSEDYGLLWEHFVLNELHANLQTRAINYWRDKHGHEIDFILARRSSHPTAIECKWTANNFDPGNLKLFRKTYTKGDNYVVSSDVDDPFIKHYDGLAVTFVSLAQLVAKLGAR